MANRPKTYKKRETDGQKIVKLAKERYDRAREAQSDENRQFDDDVSFTFDDTYQWPSAIRKQREIDNRPCLTVNRMPIFVRSVVNEYRQNTPAINVSPVDSGADKEVAEIFSGIIRHIEQQSGAEMAKENAFTYSVAGGKGFYRLTTDYIDDGFEQDIFIKPILNTRTVTYDCDSHSLDGSDWNWCFIEDTLSEEEFKRKWPDEDMSSWPSDVKDGWTQDNKIRIAEYFYREMEKITLCLLANGEVVEESEVQEGMEVVDTRESTRPIVKWCILGGSAEEPLEQKDWAGKYIPVIPVFGDQVIINGKRQLLSLIRFAKGAQQMLNYWRSTETELLALQNKAPFLVTPLQIKGHEALWEQANSANLPFLTYNADGQAGAPQRQGFASPPSGVLAGAANAARDIMDTTGIQEAGLGIRSNETSGRAINARSAQADRASFHFIDNAARADRYCGIQLVNLIPKIYDQARVVRALGLDGTEKMTPINQPVQEKDKFGRSINKIYDLSVGTYDVVVTSGANFTTQRQQSQELMAQIIQGNPQMMAQMGDLMFKVMDVPYAQEMSERMKKFLPPGIVEDEEEQKLPPEIQAQIEQMMAEKEQLMQMLMEMEGQTKDRQADIAIKAKELEIKQYDAETKRMQAMQSSQPVMPSGVDELDKIQADIDLKLKLKEMELDHAEEMELFRARLKFAEKDETVGDLDGAPSPLGLLVMDVQRSMAEMSARLEQMTANQNKPKEVIRDESGVIIGIKPVEDV